MSSLRAFIETVRIYKEQNVCDHLWQYGARLKAGMNQVAKECGLSEHFKMDGPAISLNYLTYDAEHQLSPAFRTLFSQEMVRHGVLMPWLAVSLAHGNEQLDETLRAVKASLEIYTRALTDGIDKYLEGPAIKPVFRKFN